MQRITLQWVTPLWVYSVRVYVQRTIRFQGSVCASNRAEENRTQVHPSLRIRRAAGMLGRSTSPSRFDPGRTRAADEEDPELRERGRARRTPARLASMRRSCPSVRVDPAGTGTSRRQGAHCREEGGSGRRPAAAGGADQTPTKDDAGTRQGRGAQEAGAAEEVVLLSLRGSWLWPCGKRGPRGAWRSCMR